MRQIPKFSFAVRLTPIRSIAAVAVTFLLAFFTTKCGLSEEEFLKTYNELRKIVNLGKLNNKTINEIDNQLNQKINSNPKLLDYKIKSEIDNAINNVTPEYDRIIESKKNTYRYIEERINEETCYSEECKSLGGPMRICSPWISDCPLTDQEDPANLKR